MSRSVAKIERIYTDGVGHAISADLYLDKGTGMFFADVGGRRIQADTKEKTVQLVKAGLAGVAQVAWREVILLRVNGLPADSVSASSENSKPVFHVDCSFTYLRRERAANPLQPKKTIEREHREDFEKRVLEARKRAVHFEHTRKAQQERADVEEAALRDARAVLAHVESQWTYLDPGVTEYEMAYSEEAWTGILRIAQALIDTQARLDAFCRAATPEKLVQLVTGDALRMLPEATDGDLEP